MSFPIAVMRAAAARAVSASGPNGVPSAEALDETDLEFLRLQCRSASRTCRNHGLDPIVLRIAALLDRVADACEAATAARRRGASS
jgi:hypothetical protein